MLGPIYTSLVAWEAYPSEMDYFCVHMTVFSFVKSHLIGKNRYKKIGFSILCICQCLGLVMFILSNFIPLKLIFHIAGHIFHMNVQ